MGLGKWLSSLFDDDEPAKAKPAPAPVERQVRLGAWGRPDTARQSGQVSPQQYSLSTGRQVSANNPPVLQSRRADEWRTQLLRDAANNPAPTEQWKQENLWEPGKKRTQEAPGLNRTNQALLEALGWTVPGTQAAPGTADFESMLDMSKAKDLGRHEYNIGRPELELLQMATEGKKGVTEGKRLTDEDRRVATGQIKAVPLTQEAYKALTPDQKRAVDFNTLLVAAREKDLALTDEEGKSGDYDKSIEALFGKEGGSEKYAPNTVKLLQDIGYKGQGQDLDEYLSLDRLTSMDELGSFKLTPDEQAQQGALAPRSKPGVKTYTDVRSTANQLLADADLVEQAGTLIDEALKNPQAWDLPSAAQLRIGELPKGLDVPWGYAPFDAEGVSSYRLNADGLYDNEGDATKDWFFKDAYDHLSIPEQSISALWTGVTEHGLGEQDIQDMFNYFDIRSKRDLEIGVVDPALRSPQDMRSLLGLGG